MEKYLALSTKMKYTGLHWDRANPFVGPYQEHEFICSSKKHRNVQKSDETTPRAEVQILHTGSLDLSPNTRWFAKDPGQRAIKPGVASEYHWV